MSRFIDAYLGPRIAGYPMSVAPMWSTQLVTVDSGDEQVNQRWEDALREINIPEGVRDHAEFEALKRHWLVMAGPAHTFPLRDPLDFATVDLTTPNVVPVTSGQDQRFGTGDGLTTVFQLSKTYTVGGVNYTRPIVLPVVSSVVVHIDGVLPGAISPATIATVTRYGGTVSFNHAPHSGAVLTWGGLFDLLVRFEADDTFKGMLSTYTVSGFADIPLREVPFCND